MRNIIGWILAWFSIEWWLYLLDEPTDSSYTSFWNRFWCRANGHPHGVHWYNVNGTEPDMRCKNCGDDLG